MMERVDQWTCPKCGQAFRNCSPNGVRHLDCAPGLLRKAKNYRKAIAADRAAGHARRTPEQVADIRAICAACVGDGGYYDAERDICTHPSCGCPIGVKRRVGVGKQVVATIAGMPATKPESVGQKCPVGKW